MACTIAPAKSTKKQPMKQLDWGKRKREDVDASAMTDEVSAVASALDASTVKKMELPAHVKDIRHSGVLRSCSPKTGLADAVNG